MSILDEEDDFIWSDNIFIDFDDDNRFVYQVGDFSYVDGGEGFDTLVLEGRGSLVFTDDNLVNIELIELAEGSFDLTFDSSYSSATELTAFSSHSVIVNASASRADFIITTGSDDAAARAIVFTGAGHDVITGGAGHDALGGGDGDDIIHGAAGFDRLYGGDGDDTLHGGSGKDSLIGGDGSDRLLGGDDNDYMWGDAGNDVLEGGSGHDLMWGGAGDDLLKGGEGGDYIWSNAGDDTVLGGAGDDSLYGSHDGNDRLVGGEGNDRLYGGDGDDWLIGSDNIYDSTRVSGDNILIAGGGNDMVFGGAGSDRLEGGEGDDRLYGRHGADYIEGGEGSDDLYGGRDSDELRGGIGDDYLSGDGESDRLFGGEGDDEMHGGTEDDYLSGDGGDDRLFGGDGNDEIHGGEGSDLIRGGIGDDVIYAGAGDDHITYDADGKDVIHGGDGDDTIHVFNGALTEFGVVIDGGGGSDTLRYHGTFVDDVLGSNINNVERIDFHHRSDSGVVGDATIDPTMINLTFDSTFEGAIVIDGSYNFYGSEPILSELHIDASASSAEFTILGGASDDRLEGGRSADSIFGGAGDDTLVYDLDSTDEYDGGTQSEVLGLGDVLLVEGEDTEISSDLFGESISGLEVLDIRGSGDNTLNLSAFDAADRLEALTDTDSFIVKGNEGDAVLLDAEQFIADGQVDIAGDTYVHYVGGTGADGSTVDLYINNSVSITVV
ncbi:MAG: calcium-binding protein [Coxiellaceae bacterium]|nr:calcium-binding protein [Coxiellaceae bacterium]